MAKSRKQRSFQRQRSAGNNQPPDQPPTPSAVPPAQFNQPDPEPSMTTSLNLDLAREEDVPAPQLEPGARISFSKTESNDPSPRSDNLITNQLSSIQVENEELSTHQPNDQQHFFDDQSMNKSISTLSYIERLKMADVSQLAMTPPPRKFTHLPLWIEQHFSDVFPSISTPSVSNLVANLLSLLGCFSYKEFSLLRFQTPVFYHERLGRDQYPGHKPIIDEILIIGEFISRQQSLSNPYWAYESYLTMREQRKLASLPTEVSIHKAVPIPADTPPPYTSVSPVLRGPIQRPQRTFNANSSYRSSPPGQVDSQGNNYYGNTFAGGYTHVSNSSRHGLATKHAPNYDPDGFSVKDESPVDTIPIQTLADRWDAAEASIGSNTTDKIKFMRSTSYLRFSALPKTRSAISHKSEWDGMRDTFDQYRTKVEGHLMQVGAGYLIDEHFLKMYKLSQLEYVLSDEFWAKYQVGVKQVKYDRTYLYGIIVSTNKNAYNKGIMQHKSTQDGILTWLEFLTLYAHDGSKDLKLEQLEDLVHTPYTPGGAQKLYQYIDKLQDTMERLDTLSIDPYSDRTKKTLLLRNIRDTPGIAHLYQHCKDSPDMSYEETAAYLRSNSIMSDYVAKQSNRPLPATMLTATKESETLNFVPDNKVYLTLNETIKLLNTMAQESSTVKAYQVLSSSQSLRDGLSIHPDIWKQLDQHMRTKLLDIKKQLRDERAQPAKLSKSTTNKPTSSIPKAPDASLPPQYPSMVNNSQQIHSLLALSSKDFTEEEEETDEEELFSQLQISHLKTVSDTPDDIEVRAHFEYSEVYNDKIYAISDGGADSCVLGAHAHVIHYTGRSATLVGYDPATTRTNKVPIVSAYLKVMSQVGVPVFLKINQAPYHQNNKITLLSEYQVREHKYIIDSVATKHFKAPNVPGTQRLVLSDLLHVKFEDRGGIMGFEIMEITSEDFQNDEPIYDVFEITGQDTWIPKRFQHVLTTTMDTPELPSPDSHQEDVFVDAMEGDIEPEPYFFDPENLEHDSACHYAQIDSSWDEIGIVKEDILPDPDVDVFLAHLTYDDLTGYSTTNPEYFGYPAIDPNIVNDDGFDTFAFAVKSWHRVLYDKIDPKKVQPYLGFRPIDVIKATLKNTTQLARMVIRYPMQRHYKARAPHLNVIRLDEPVSTDPAYANCPSLHHGFTGFQAFFGLISHHIDVYGFHRKGRNFPAIYRQFIKENGAPSVLRRDNEIAEQSDNVMDIQRELYIKDQFSEVENQWQNPVESQAIKWLKHSSHTLLDRTGAPDTAWYFAVKYLSEIHNICYDKLLGMCPKQKRFGRTVDISAYLQFHFWQRVLYLNHEEKWPHSNERPGYWVGVAHNVGDPLTYWIYDDQAKRLFARSVVRPFSNNLRVKWDPAFASIPFKNTAKIGGDIMPNKQIRMSELSEAMDPYDQDEEDPESHFFDTNMEELTTNPDKSSILKSWNQHETRLRNGPTTEEAYQEDQGFDTNGPPFVPVEKSDSYSGISMLRYSNKDIPFNPDIPTFPQRGRESYNRVQYDPIFQPPDEINPMDEEEKGRNQEKRGDTTIPEDEPVHDQAPTISELRRSKRLNKGKSTKINHITHKTNSTIWTNGRWNKFWKVVAMIGTQFVPTHVMAMPSSDLLNPLSDLVVKQMEPLNTAPRMEEIRAYHLNLDRINQLLDPDEEDERWRVQKVLKHRLVTSKDQPERMFVKVRYADQVDSYMPLDTLRIHDPFIATMYAEKNNLKDQDHWKWVHHYIQDNPCTSILLNVFKTTTQNEKQYKFGVEVPRSPKHAIAMDKAAGNTGWQDSMDLELNQLNDFKVFKVLPDNYVLPKEYKRIPYQIVFDVKFDGRLKSRLVAGGHRTPDVPREEVFSGVVSMEAVRLGFFLAHLNNLLVCAGDIGNAFLNGKTREKVFIIAGPEFGPKLAGKRLLIDKSLYGLKTSAARFHEHCSARLRKMGFKPSKADADLWIKKLPDGTYEYMARFVDDLIAFSKDPMALMKELEQTYVMKGVGKPQYYLGGDVVDLPNEWNNEHCKTAFSAETYIRNVIPKLAAMCNKKGFRGYKTPFSDSYHAEMDTSPLCDTETISKYKSLIGSANWIITLGRFDIAYAVSTLSRYSVAPREGHFEAMERVFGYLDKFPDGKLVIDPTEPKIRQVANFNSGFNWSELYPDAEEDIPHDMPVPDGKMATLTCYVDADHARDKVTCRSVTGIVMLLNNTPITWLSKRQRTVETSTYGSEMVAARIATDLIIEMRYKLRMLGVKVEETSVMVGDNMAVVINTTLPSSSLKKKHQACNYHRIREAIAAGIFKFGYIDTSLNLADVCTKPLGSESFHLLLKDYMFRRPASIDLIPSPLEKALNANLMDC